LYFSVPLPKQWKFRPFIGVVGGRQRTSGDVVLVYHYTQYTRDLAGNDPEIYVRQYADYPSEVFDPVAWTLTTSRHVKKTEATWGGATGVNFFPDRRVTASFSVERLNTLGNWQFSYQLGWNFF
jgi:hypothetical protein